MDLALRVLLVGLAAWRVSALLSYERGPFALLERLRQAVRLEDEPDGSLPNGWGPSFRLEVEEALSCVWCLSPWAAVLLWGVWAVSPAVVGVAAAAAVVVAVERWNHGPARTTDEAPPRDLR